MPTLKQRVNLTMPAHINRSLSAAARRDRTTIAAKALDLVRVALELEEDAALLSLAEIREKGGGKNIPHAKAWV